MKLLTRDTDYAIRALVYMTGRPNKLVSASELVKELKIPRPFLRKLLQILNREGLLISSKGAKGGFMLARDPRRIVLAKIMQIFQGSFRLNECSFKKKECPDKKVCPLNKIIGGIEKDVFSKLSAVSVASLEGIWRNAK